MTTSPTPDARLLTFFDALEEPIVIATAVRDRDGRILDFRLAFVNQAAAEWAGTSRESMLGRITGELLPQFRARGFFDTLVEIVRTGVPYHEVGVQFDDAITGGAWVGGVYDLSAIRLGDGYLGTWSRQAPPLERD